MYLQKVFCPICGFITELEFIDKENYYDSNYENCTLCNMGIYEVYTNELIFNDETGYYECKK